MTLHEGEARELIAAWVEQGCRRMPEVPPELRGWTAVVALEEAITASFADNKMKFLDLARELLRSKPTLVLDDEQTIALADIMVSSTLNNYNFPVNYAVKAMPVQLPEGARMSLERVVEKLADTRDRNERAAALTLQERLGTDLAPLRGGEAWTDAALPVLVASPAWTALIMHARGSGSGRPGKKWKAAAEPLLRAVEDFDDKVRDWFAKIGPQLVGPDNGDALRGLAAFCTLRKTETCAFALADLVRRGLKKSPQGLVSSKASKAGVLALGAMGTAAAVGALRDLERTMKADWLRPDLEAALAEALEQTGPVEEQVPTLGFTEVGRLSRAVGQFTGLLEVTPAGPELRWRTPAGKLQAGVPAALGREHKTEVQQMQGLVKELKQVLGSQKERLEHLFLRREPLTLKAWQDLLDHPVVGVLSRRLLWCVGDQVLAYQDGPISRDYDPVTPAGDVRLWHPALASPEEVAAWQAFVEEAIQLQPFPQVYREVYADPQEWSGRKLRQNVYQAMRQQRGWQHEWLGNWDSDVGPAVRKLPEWDLKAEWDISPDPDSEANPLGLLEHVVSGAVSFHRLDGTTLSIEQVPVIPRTELLRDVASLARAAQA